MESSIFVLDPIKGVFWPFKVDRRIYLTDTVLQKMELPDACLSDNFRFLGFQQFVYLLNKYRG